MLGKFGELNMVTLKQPHTSTMVFDGFPKPFFPFFSKFF